MTATRSLLAPLLAALTLAGCVRLPPATRPALPDERAAITALLEAHEAARGQVVCTSLERVDVTVLPLDELHAWCLSDTADACVSVIQRHPLAPPSTWIRVREGLGREQHTRAVQHEAAHVLRHSWAYGDQERWRTGERADCAIMWAADMAHCDTALWASVLEDAWRRYAAGDLP